MQEKTSYNTIAGPEYRDDTAATAIKIA